MSKRGQQVSDTGGISSAYKTMVFVGCKANCAQFRVKIDSFTWYGQTNMT